MDCGRSVFIDDGGDDQALPKLSLLVLYHVDVAACAAAGLGPGRLRLVRCSSQFIAGACLSVRCIRVVNSRRQSHSFLGLSEHSKGNEGAANQGGEDTCQPRNRPT